ncbi:serine hydrolase [Rhodococcus sp. NPDC058521]|uniref:serine hydrolase n=1 Tax=Rhodococcus sp. NPDC058521 TaxID=3346536 RepID=UPI003654699A
MRTNRSFPVVCALALTGALVAAGCTSEQSTPDSTSQAPNQTEDASPPDPGTVAGVEIPAGQIDDAVSELDGLVDSLMSDSGVPGMSVAVVHDGRTVYAKGFGVREEGADRTVDADTVFPLASVSKSVGATVVAHEVGTGTVDWDTPVTEHLPWFALNDPWVTEHLTIADLYAHRSGLPDHAGDRLEDLGYDRRQVLERLRLLPLTPFRSTYEYTNFGVTAAAESVAAAAGKDWATLSNDALYEPLGMTSTSSRFVDYEARPNRAVGHQLIDGEYVHDTARQPDAQSPAGGVSSSANDMAAWLKMLLGDGTADDRHIVDADALLPAITPQIVSSPAQSPDSRAGAYGYGFNVSTSAAGRTTISHSGGFQLGAATNFMAIPSADVAIVALTNGSPIGLPETLTAEFADLVQFGEIREDWRSMYAGAFAPMNEPEGELVGAEAPSSPTPPRPPDTYAGTYENPYWGPARVEVDAGQLYLVIGPDGERRPLEHWDGETFTFTISNENAPPGTVSKATFAGNAVTLEYFDEGGLGRFERGEHQ